MKLRWIVLPLLALFACDDSDTAVVAERTQNSIRVATYNTHLARGEA